MTKLFSIGKLVISANNIIALMYIKGILWIDEIPFPSPDKVCQHILDISNES